MVYIIQQGNSKRETDEQQNLGVFFFRDILFSRQGEDQTAQAKTHFVQAITF